MDRLKEIWKPVLGHKGEYSVSNLGRVRSERRKKGSWVGRILKGGVARGYRSINMGGRMRSVHSLVIETFLYPRPKGLTINHKDCNKANNKLSNLEYLTMGDNIRHAWANGMMPSRSIGERHPSSKLTARQVRFIRKRYSKNNITMTELGNKFGISYQSIGKIIYRKSWKNI